MPRGRIGRLIFGMGCLAATAVVGHRLLIVVQRLTTLQPRLAAIERPRVLDYADSRIDRYLRAAGACANGAASDAHVVIVALKHPEWGETVKGVVDAVQSKHRGDSRIRVTVVTSDDWSAMWAPDGGPAIVPIADATSFSRHTGLDFLPSTVVLGTAGRIVAAFDGIWPAADDLNAAIERALTQAAAPPVLQRGLPLDRVLQ